MKFEDMSWNELVKVAREMNEQIEAIGGGGVKGKLMPGAAPVSAEQAALAADFGQAESRMNTGVAQQNADHFGQVGGSEVAAPVSAEPVMWHPVDGKTHGYEGAVVLRHKNGDYRIAHTNWLGNHLVQPYPPSKPKELAYVGTLDMGYEYWMPLEAPVAAQAQPTMPPLTDAMRAVIRNEHDVYGDEDALYAALCAAAQAQPDHLPDATKMVEQAGALTGQNQPETRKDTALEGGAQPSRISGELPELPDIASTDDWDAVLDDIRRYGDACYCAGFIAAAGHCENCDAAQGQNTDVPKPVAFAKDGVLFWHGDYSTWRGFNGELYLSAPPQRDADKADAERYRAWRSMMLKEYPGITCHLSEFLPFGATVFRHPTPDEWDTAIDAARKGDNQAQQNTDVPDWGYAGVTVFVGDKKVTKVTTQLELEKSNGDRLLDLFEGARFTIDTARKEAGQ